MALSKEEIHVFRNFVRLKNKLEEVGFEPEDLRLYGSWLLPLLDNGTEEEKRLSRRFFNHYGQEIAGPCGCSKLYLDHWRIPINKAHFEPFICVCIQLYYSPYFNSRPSATQWARAIDCIFDTGYPARKLANMIRYYSPGNAFSWLNMK